MRYLITFAYDGASFRGYQRQNKLKTVQGSLENILTYINNNKQVNINASGRTDAGVHALNQKAHFDLDVKVTLYGLKKALNKKLNGEIYIKDIVEMDNNFHARYNVKDKTYIYYINTLEYDPIKRNYIYQYNNKLDTSLMNRALSFILGEHDFRGFCTNAKERENCIRTIYSTSINENNGIIEIKMTGNGFLRKMVRNIVGTLIEVGSNRIDINEMKKILDNKGLFHNRKTAPACGLYLTKVNYDWRMKNVRDN